jgi:hypothetical protein
MTVISNTLAVFPSGSNTEIELINVYTSLAVSAGVLTANAFSNNDVESAADFTVAPPMNGVDGAQVRIRVLNTGSGNINVSFDASIHLGSNDSPDVIQPEFASYYLLEFNGVSGFWALLNLAAGY